MYAYWGHRQGPRAAGAFTHTGLTWALGSRQTDTIAGGDTEDAAAGQDQALLSKNRNGLQTSGGHGQQERTRTVSGREWVSAAHSFWEGWACGRLFVALIQPHLRAGH